MTKKKQAPEEQPKTLVVSDPKDKAGKLKCLGGSMSDQWNNTLVIQTVNALWLAHSDEAKSEQQMEATVRAMQGIAPADELEGMMVAQMIAAHNSAMECYRRAMLGEQTFEGRTQNLNYAAKLSRTWATMLHALNKHRGKGQQKVTVEHVNVHSGGQAIVGNVEPPGGGSRAKTGDQPHAK